MKARRQSPPAWDPRHMLPMQSYPQRPAHHVYGELGRSPDESPEADTTCLGPPPHVAQSVISSVPHSIIPLVAFYTCGPGREPRCKPGGRHHLQGTPSTCRPVAFICYNCPSFLSLDHSSTMQLSYLLDLVRSPDVSPEADTTCQGPPPLAVLSLS